MKRYGTLLVILALFLVMLVVLPGVLHAQDPSDPVDDPSGIDPSGDIDAPIDGGLGFLIVAGVGYGIKKYRDLKKKELIEEEIN